MYKLHNMEECCICLESNYVAKTECNHYICCGCMIELKNLICPCCRRLFQKIPKNVKKIIMKNNREVFIDIQSIDEFPSLY